jgi:hypothetical protein
VHKRSTPWSRWGDWGSVVVTLVAHEERLEAYVIRQSDGVLIHFWLREPLSGVLAGQVDLLPKEKDLAQRLWGDDSTPRSLVVAGSTLAVTPRLDPSGESPSSL